MKKITAENLNSIVTFVRLREAVCLVDKRRYEEIPPWAKKTGNIEDVIDEVGTSLGDHGASEMFVYSSPEDVEDGIATLKHKSGYSALEVMAFRLPMAMILSYAEKLGDASLWINHGLKNGFQLYGDNIFELKRIAILARVATFKKVYIVQTEDGRPMSRKAKTGNQYAIAFLSEQDAEFFIKDHKDQMPNCSIAKYHPLDLANDLLNSKLEGLTLDYKLESQLLLNREHLIDLIKIKNIIPNPFVEKWKKLFPAKSYS